MQHGMRKRYWLSGLLGLALAQIAPLDAQASGRGEVWQRAGGTYERRAPESTWRHRFGGGYGRRDARGPSTAPAGGGSTPGPVSSGSGGDPEAPEPTAALLFGLGALAVHGATRKSRAR
jgi:hypothetical protein